MSQVRLKQLNQDGASPDEVIKWNDTAGKWEPGTGGGSGIGTGTGDPTGGSDGDFYYDTVAQALWYNDTAVWEMVGIVADDLTLEVAGGDLHVKDDGITLTQIDAKTDTNPGVLGYDASGDPVEIEEGAAGQVLTSAGTAAASSFQDRDLHVRSLTLESPHGAGAEDFSIFWTKVDITATRIAYAVRGATPSITCTVNSNTSRSSAGTVVHTITTGTSTAGTDAAPSGTAAIPAGAYVWLETTAVGAATDELFIAIEYTED
jgi:hypothetical protein